MENKSMHELDTFTTLKYRHVAGTDGKHSFTIGTVYWLNDIKELHRVNGPAVEYLDGTKFWYLNGQLHREDGPAIEYSSGSKFWYLNGQLHREDGPAIERSTGTCHWYLNGEPVFEQN